MKTAFGYLVPPRVRKLASLAVVSGLALALAGCRSASSQSITQVATIDALMAGVYDGHMSLAELSGHGDFGIGTFEGMDGEMIFLDGAFYRARADGKVYRPALSERTPFACVTKFAADHREALPGATDMTALEARIDALVPEQNRFCAFKVRGVFNRVRVRSVPFQKKPYRPLAEVTKTQAVFDLAGVRGTLIGFRSPPFVKGVNVIGYHMHFLADDHASGGHVLEVEIGQGVLETDSAVAWLNIFLPTASASFEASDLTKDRSRALQAVEQDARR